jgi:regulator of sirC expression with transglutaminase-like and TPR domain
VNDLEVYVEHSDDTLDREAIAQRVQELRRALN